jgi:hypothetical protein
MWWLSQVNPKQHTLNVLLVPAELASGLDGGGQLARFYKAPDGGGGTPKYSRHFFGCQEVEVNHWIVSFG